MAELSERDEQLVREYLNQIAALAVRAEVGEDVSAPILAAVQQAYRHFGTVKESSALDNLQWMAEQLKLRADSVRQRVWAHAAFDRALTLVRERIRNSNQ